MSANQLAVAVLVLLQTVCTFLPAAKVFRRTRGIDPFSPPVFWGLYGIANAIRPLQIAFLDQWQVKFDLTGESVVAPLLLEALVLHLVGTAAFTFAYVRTLGRYPAKTESRPAPRLGKLLVGATVLGAIGLFSYTRVILSVGGVSYLANSMGLKRELFSGLGLFVVFADLLPLAAAVAIAAGIDCRKRGVLIGGLAAWVLGTGLLLTLGGRAAALTCIVTLVLIVHYRVRRIPMAAVMVGGMLLIHGTYLFGMARENTVATGTFDIPLGVSLNPVSGLSEHARHWAATDRFLVFLSGVPNTVPFQYGTTYARLFTNFVPRAWWPSKPSLTEAAVYAELFGWHEQAYAVLPAGVTADYYLQFGVLAVLLGWGTTGFVAAKAYGRMLIGERSTLGVVVYAIALLTICHGLTNLALMTFATHAGPVLAVWVISRPPVALEPSNRMRTHVSGSPWAAS